MVYLVNAWGLKCRGRQAGYNTPFVVSLALVYGDVATHRFTDNILNSEQIQKMMRKIKVEHDPELDREYPQKRPAIAEITTKSGKVFLHRIDLAKGEPEYPLSKSEIEKKFHSLASKVVNEEGRRKVIDFVGGLETTNDIRKLSPLLKATSKA